MTMGADGVELDVRRTADGHLAVHHDATLGRTTPDAGELQGRAIVDLTAAELAALGDGLVPPLGDVLDCCHPTLVNIEIKSDRSESDFDPAYPVADAVIALLAARASGAGGANRTDDRVLVTSFDLGAIDAVVAAGKAAGQPVRTGYLIADHEDRMTSIDAARDAGHVGVMPHHTMVDADFMGAARAAELFVGVWTVNEPADIRQMVDHGVDAIISDTPDVALSIVDEVHGRRST